MLSLVRPRRTLVEATTLDSRKNFMLFILVSQKVFYSRLDSAAGSTKIAELLNSYTSFLLSGILAYTCWNDGEAPRASFTGNLPPSQKVARTVTHSATLPPKISVIEAMMYSWVLSNLAKEPIATKQTASILSSL
jgi:hypothetical protein